MALRLTTYYSNRLAPGAGVPLAGLRLHLRPDTGLATAPDGTLATWADQSGHGLVATPEPGQPAPTLGTLAGGPALYFTAGQRLAGLDLGGAAPVVLTAVLLVQREAGATSIMPIHWGQGTAQDLWLDSDHFGLNTYNGDIYGIAQAGARFDAPVLVVAEVHASQPRAFRLWLNGQPQYLAQQQSGPGAPALDTVVRVGGYPGWLWRGAIGEVAVYDRALTDAEQLAVYEEVRSRYPALPAYVPPPPPPAPAPDPQPPTAADVPAGPQAWWRAANGLTPDTAAMLVSWADLSGHGHTLLARTGYAPPALRPWAGGQAVYFSGQQALDPLDLGGAAPAVRPAVLLLQKDSGATGVMPIHFGQGNSQDLWCDSDHFGLNTYNGDIYGIAQAEAALSQPVLVVAEVHSGQPGSFRLWLNGQPQALAQQQSGPGAPALDTVVRIGGNPGWLWRGYLGEVLLYDRALTDAEQAQLVAYVRGRYTL